MSEVLKNVFGSIISAILIALVISFWNDFFYKSDNLTGYWNVELETIQTSHEKFKGLKVYYDFIINQEGNRLIGSGEKISEQALNSPPFEYDAKKRTHLELTGAVTYKVFTKNRVDLHYKEEGRLRPSSSILKLRIDSKNKMSGKFMSTIAESSGNVVFTRKGDI